MDEREKLGCSIMLGMALLIGGTYCLFSFAGERPYLIPVPIVVWLVLVILTIRYFQMGKKKIGNTLTLDAIWTDVNKSKRNMKVMLKPNTKPLNGAETDFGFIFHSRKRPG